MSANARRIGWTITGEKRDWRRLSTVAATILIALTRASRVSAHGDTATGGIEPWHGVVLVGVGVGIIAAGVLAKRFDWLSPTTALHTVLGGIVIVAVGAILFDGFSADPTYTASSIPFPRSWYPAIGLGLALSIAIGSLVVGVVRWPTRPRYTFLGILIAFWIAYPYLLPPFVADTHPLGYALVLGLPILVGYILWTDVGDEIVAVLRDPVARRFGVATAIVLAVFFVTMTGYLSFFPEEGAPHEVTVVTLPVVYQLVIWPTLEIVLPHIPLFLAVSPGQVLIVGTISALVGLNAAFIAGRWREEERAGLAQGTAGTAAVVGSCTCGCCGPIVAKITVLAAGPALAAPLYWVFVDTSSPLTALFTVGSVVVFVATLLYTVETARFGNGPPGATLSD